MARCRHLTHRRHAPDGYGLVEVLRRRAREFSPPTRIPSRPGCDHYRRMGDDVLSHRLRRLGEAEVEHSVAAAQLARMATVRPRRFTTGAAVALALTIGGSATAVGVSLAVQQPSSDLDRGSTQGCIVVAGRCASHRAGRPCRASPACGLGSLHRTASVRRHTSGRRACASRGSQRVRMAAGGVPRRGGEHDDDDGALPGQSPRRRHRASEQRAQRATDLGSTRTTRRRPTGPPDSVPPGPPDSVPNGPPDSVPPGPPDSVPNGPPAEVPAGPPESVPAGPPVSVPAGPPVSVPAGPPTDLPSDNAGGARGGG